MKSPTIVNYIGAYIGSYALIGGGLACSLYVGFICEPNWTNLQTLGFLFRVLFAVVIAFPFGWLVSSVFVSPIVYAVVSRVNGGPLKEGDKVLILMGPYRGLETNVYSMWQGVSVRVRIDDNAEQSYKDVFSQEVLFKICSVDSTS